ncbi:MAG: hypothetical protein JWO76_3121 [Nocardioides sp.]|nr:hypothetical protein [Nocardioides sp.]
MQPADGDSTVTQVGQSPEAPGEASTPEVSEEPDLPSDNDVRAYIDAVASSNVATLERAMKLTKKGSLAEAYLIYQVTGENANIDGGYPTVSDLVGVTSKKGGYQACYAGDAADPVCYLYADIEGADGKIVDFTINGLQLEKRISVGNGTFVSGTAYGVSGKFATSYVTAADNNLLITFQLRTTADPVSIISATYRSPDGRQSQAANIAGPYDLAPRSIANFSAMFPGAKPGGTMALSYYRENASDASLTFKTR